MTSGTRISSTQRDALSLLAELCELSPDVRLGQLMAHLGFLGEDETGRTLLDIDDEQLLAVMYRHRGELVNRTPLPQPPDLASGAAIATSAPNVPLSDMAGERET